MYCENIVIESGTTPQRIASSKIIIIGLGNPILGDDGVGWWVAKGVQKKLVERETNFDRLEIQCCALGGLSLMERLAGFDRAIIIDAIQTGYRRIGQVDHYSLQELPDFSAGHMTAAHDTSLQTAMTLGREMGAELPNHLDIIGIEVEQVYEFSDSLSQEVAAAIPAAIRLVFNVLFDLPSLDG